MCGSEKFTVVLTTAPVLTVVVVVVVHYANRKQLSVIIFKIVKVV